LIDFARSRHQGVAVVERLEYDPNRTAFIALIRYENGTLSYILAPQHLNVGEKVESSEEADIKIGNCLPLSRIPVGTVIPHGELKPL
jgi:large subunit ribosomal protein L2